jgi:hypothetical protein
MAARRRISLRMLAVTRRTWPVIHTEAVGVVVAAIPLVDVAPDFDTAGRLDVGDGRLQRMAVERIAVQGAGVQHELPALRLGHRGGDRDLAAELVGCSRLAFADALDLRRVQGVDLAAALPLVLGQHPVRKHQQRPEPGFHRLVAGDLALDVADHPAEPGAQELQLPTGALERNRSFWAAFLR